MACRDGEPAVVLPLWTMTLVCRWWNRRRDALHASNSLDRSVSTTAQTDFVDCRMLVSTPLLLLLLPLLGAPSGGAALETGRTAVLTSRLCAAWSTQSPRWTKTRPSRSVTCVHADRIIMIMSLASQAPVRGLPRTTWSSRETARAEKQKLTIIRALI